jgi:hypothetical protein
VREVTMTAPGSTLTTRLSAVWRRVGPVLATLVLLAMLLPAWVGFNGLEMGGVSLAAIVVEGMVLHYLLRSHPRRLSIILLAITLTIPLEFFVFGPIYVLTGADRIDQVPADALLLPVLMMGGLLGLGGLFFIGLPIGVALSLARITRAPWLVMLAEVVLWLLIVMAAIWANVLTDVSAAPEALIAVFLGALLMVPLVAIVGAGTAAGYVVGGLTGRLIRPAFESLLHSARYFRPLVWPSIGFAIGYLSMAVIFAGYYAALNLADDNAFKIEPDGATATLGDFVYYSVMTQLTLENYKIQPLARSAKMAVVAHGLLTVGWNLLFFAAMTAYVQRFWARIDQADEREDAGVLDDRIASLERQVAAEQEHASARHRELLQEIRVARGSGTSTVPVPSDERTSGDPE